ncbi:MAG: competence/damage-inducible protein A [Verrucomicrobia bacterium]|nr:competence/damage-inducible protein A [Verrucomicrobiota bacterium]
MIMSNRVTVEILNIGDELLLGIRTNSHLTYLGKQLSLLGLKIDHCQVVPDKEDSIKAAFAIATERSDIVITTGGLGPTEDDLTRESLAKLLGKKLIYNEAVFDSIKDRFLKLGRKVSEIHKKQCYQIEGSEILKNERGTAPGLLIKQDACTIILLPGPTHELIPMFEKQVLPYAKNNFCAQADHTYVQLRTCGIGESSVEDLVSPIVKQCGFAEIAFCVHLGIVDVRLSLADKTKNLDQLNQVADACRLALGDNFVGYGDISLSQVIFQKLREHQKTLAVAESCTGGLLGNAFTDIPGASKVFQGGVICYANEVKISQVSVPEEIIDQHGAVSGECAIAMASGVAENLSSDYGLSITGFAGPEGGNKENPVGTIHIGFHSSFGIWAKSVRYLGGRMDVKARAVNAALDWMRRLLIRQEQTDINGYTI